MKQSAPWGFWDLLREGPGYKVKEIVLHPGHRLSYQTHQHRREYWTIVKGSGYVVLNGEKRSITAGDRVDVGENMPHRIANTAQNEDLIFVEVQMGSQLREDDIERLEDDYGRLT